MAKISIILVNYKDYAKKYLPDCLKSLNNQTMSKSEYEIIVVNNAADDDSRAYLNQFSEIKVYERADGNYCAANNLGIKEALKNGAEYVVIANMDTEFAPLWLAELKKAIDGNPQTGIAQSKIFLYPKNEEEKKDSLINTTGNAFNFLGFGYTENYRKKNSQISFVEKYPLINGYASGCSFIIKKEVLQKIGGYDENFYMYHDDIDISLKARLAGYEIRLAPQSMLFHKYEFPRSAQMIYHMEKNRWLTFLTIYSLPTTLIILPIFLLFESGMIFYSIITGWWPKKLENLKYFCKIETWRYLRNKRNELRNLKIGSEKDFLENLRGGIYFLEIENNVLKYLVNPILEIYWFLIKLIIVW